MPHTSTQVYINKNTTPKQGITPADVGAVLVRSTQDVGQLCGDVDANGNVVNGGAGAINKWAVNKATRAPGWPRISDSDKAYYNFSIDMSNAGVIAYENALTALFTYCINNHKWDNWDYLRPRGTANNRNEPYRLTDFSGDIEGQTNDAQGHIACYNHDALVPFFVAGHSLTIQSGATSVKQDLDVYQHTSAEIDITKMHAFASPNEQLPLVPALLARHGSNDVRLFYVGSWQGSNEARMATATARVWQNTNYCMFVYTNIPSSAVDTDENAETYGTIDPEADSTDWVTIALPACNILVMVGTDYSHGVVITPGWAESGSEYLFQLTQGSDTYISGFTASVYFAADRLSNDTYVTGHVDYMYNNDTSTVVSQQETILAYVDDEERNNLCVFDTLVSGDHPQPWPQEFQESDLQNLKVRVWWEWYEGITRYVRYWDFADNVSKDAPSSIPYVTLSSYTNMYRIVQE